MFSSFIHVVTCRSTSLLLMANISLYKYAAFYLSSQWLMGIWYVFTSWLLWLMLWTLMYVFLYGSMFSFLLDIDQGVELLGHMVTLCLIFRGTADCSKVTEPCYISPAEYEGSNLSIYLSTLITACLLIIAYWVWSDISLWFGFASPWWLMKLSIFSCVYWPSVYPLWGNIYSDPLPILI